jgi:hypothetical protein
VSRRRCGPPARRRPGAWVATATVAGGLLCAACTTAPAATTGPSTSATTTLAACQASARGATVSSVEPDHALDDLWSNYLSSGKGWTGGDSVYTYTLPDGSTLYTYADSFIRGLVGDHHQRKLIYHNLFVVDGPGGFQLVTGGTAANPAPLIAAPYGKDFYLALGGSVDSDQFQAIFMERFQNGPGSLDNVPIGSVIARFSLPALSLLGVSNVPDPSQAIQWGSYVHRFGSFTYIYGASASGLHKQGYVARVGGDDLLAPWSYWDGHGWSSDPASAAAFASNVQSEFGVLTVDGLYVLISSNATVPFSPVADVWFGCSPTGPWLGQASFTLSPLVGLLGKSTWGNANVYVYDAMVQPALTGAAGNVVISYDRNSLDLSAVLANADIYEPSYLDLTITPGGV